jgi:hypothetical protein
VNAPGDTPAETPPVDTVTPVDGDEPAPVEPVAPEEETEEKAEEPKELDTTGFKFNGVDVTVDVPADLREELSSKGIDVSAVVTELYTSEDFNLSAETKEKLYEVYGKAAVESYLSSLKMQNELTLRTYNESVAAQTAANEKAWNETLEQVGGEAEWQAMELWAQGTLTDEEFHDLNKVMESGSRYAQKLAVADLLSRYKSSEGDSAPNLVAGDSLPAVSTDAALTRQQYIDGFKSGEQKKDPRAWDARRRKGIESGI